MLTREVRVSAMESKDCFLKVDRDSLCMNVRKQTCAHQTETVTSEDVLTSECS